MVEKDKDEYKKKKPRTTYESDDDLACFHVNCETVRAEI
jgi:hypothetical protein